MDWLWMLLLTTTLAAGATRALRRPARGRAGRR